MDPRARWVELMALPDDRIPIDEAALTISAVANPALDIPTGLGRLDDLSQQVASPDAAGVRRLLFEELRFAGDRTTYDDPVNSFLDRVLDRRRGIPISLSVVVMEVGRRCGVAFEAVGLPGHFLVRDSADPEVLIDAFDGGRPLDRRACQQLLRSVTGDDALLTDEMLAAVGPKAILLRMLANLDRSFVRRHDLRSLGWVSDLRAAVPGTSPGERLQLARRLADLGRFAAAAAMLEDVAGGLEGAGRTRMEADATGLRARLN